MFLKQIVHTYSYRLGSSFQEVRDIYANGKALYNYPGLRDKREMILSIQECYQLHILYSTMRSRLFIFQGYSFEIETIKEAQQRVRLIPWKDPSFSMGAIFLFTSLARLAKAVAALALAILLGTVIVAAWICSPKEISHEMTRSWAAGVKNAFEAYAHETYIRQAISLPEEPADSHVTREDILKIGRMMIGYRHVSTEELAQSNKQEGIPDGCALNLSFCDTESPFEMDKKAAIFKDLDLRITEGENCDKLIHKYEKAITRFITNSIAMDFICTPTTYGDFFQSLENTRFMLIKTRLFNSSDVTSYKGLGRLSKARIKPKHIILLRRISREELGISMDRNHERISSPFEYSKLARYLAAHYRRELLRYLREDLSPKGFRKQLLWF
jgi:hypothetical protein